MNYTTVHGSPAGGVGPVSGATLPKKSKSLANIYYPEKKLDCKEGLLVGFNMDGHLFVITTVIPRDHLEKLDPDIKNSLEKLQSLL